MAISFSSGKKSPLYSDLELIEMLKQGGLLMEKALFWMFECYFPLVNIAIRTKHIDEADAMDAYEDALMTVRDHVVSNTFQQKSSLKTYLNTIFSFKCIDKIRRNATNQSRTETAISGFMETMGVENMEITSETSQIDASVSNQKDLLRILCLDMARSKLGKNEQDLLTDALINEIKNKDLVEKYGYKDNRVVASTIYNLKDKLKRAIMELCSSDSRCNILCKPGERITL